MTDSNAGAIAQADRIELVLNRIARAVEIEDARGGSDTDNDFVWSVIVQPTPGWPEPLGADWTINGNNRFYHAEDPGNMLPVDLPGDRKYPYAMIQGGNRSVELVDDITGLTVLAAGPGQVVAACIGVSSSYRAIVGPGMNADRVAVRFSSRPLQMPTAAQASGPIRLFPTDFNWGSVSSFHGYGWLRNPTGARKLITYIKMTVNDASTAFNINLQGYPENYPNPQAPGQQIINVTPGLGTYLYRITGNFDTTVQGNGSQAGMPGKYFGYSMQVSGATPNLSGFNLWYELIY
jgi:hypothetical protein